MRSKKTSQFARFHHPTHPSRPVRTPGTGSQLGCLTDLVSSSRAGSPFFARFSLDDFFRPAGFFSDDVSGGGAWVEGVADWPPGGSGEVPACGVCGTVQGLEDGRGRADYNGEIEDVLRYTIALPD